MNPQEAMAQLQSGEAPDFSISALKDVLMQAHQKGLMRKIQELQEQGQGTGFQGPGGGFGPAMNPQTRMIMQQMKQMDPNSVLREGEMYQGMDPNSVVRPGEMQSSPLNPVLQQYMQYMQQQRQNQPAPMTDWMQRPDPYMMPNQPGMIR